MHIEKRETYGENGQFIDSLVFVIRLLHQVLIDILEVRDRNVFLKIFIKNLSIVNKFNLLVCHF
jgi:hypothetical protein